ncbi:biotin synthase BioB [Aliikangiella coralliicola]|uniref:Biotin synthase n=1 Tax=Aliikangiella coralliicola TaxID=2592383 RepID=A0A545UJR6_9GAMM|nr:biotin synthase BioB [Aliikangiella coralliicola]TQV89715.1 biotin synthase BioB [Aliikangiella coralliicola]
MHQPNSLSHLTVNADIRHDWQLSEVKALYELPFNDLIFRAQAVHRQNFEPNQVQASTLMSIKTGACPEDCAYCPQSGHYNTGLSKEQLVALEEVVTAAKNAKRTGATRFCMGAAWRSPRAKDFPVVLEMVKAVKKLEMETCVTLGMLNEEQATQLKHAGLDYYNHNLDTSAEYYSEIITTRTYQDRLDTLQRVRDAGINVCAGGILGMGETLSDRLNLIRELANLPEHPQSVPINQLIAVKGTPLEDARDLDPFEFIRMIAVARIVMPQSYVRLSAGRENMSDEMQAMCFFAGANSIFYGEKLLTTENPDMNHDLDLFKRLGIEPEGGTPETKPCPRKLAEEQAQLEAAAKASSQTEKPLFYNAAS